MVDIHSHILPEVDDGADSMEEALEMAKLAVSGGTKEMVVTPHCNIPHMFGNYAGDGIEDTFLEFKEQLAQNSIPLKVYLGAEVYITDSVIDLLRFGKLNTINGQKYILVEFAFGEEPEYMYKMFGKLLSEGLVPIVAHPERYYASLCYPEMIYSWVKSGVIVQINKGSLMGRFGKEAEAVARVLLGHNLVHCIASDAHTSWRRTPYMLDAMDAMTDLFDEKYAKNVLENNPHKIIMGEEPKLYNEPEFPRVNIRRML